MDNIKLIVLPLRHMTLADKENTTYIRQILRDRHYSIRSVATKLHTSKFILKNTKGLITLAITTSMRNSLTIINTIIL